MAEPYGKVTKIEFEEDPRSGKSMGTALMTFATAREARDAKEHIESLEIGKAGSGKNLLVSFRPKAVKVPANKTGAPGGGGDGDGGSGGIPTIPPIW